MKAVILAGGLGTRIAEESDQKPKPMVEVGGRPLLWHIMKNFSAYGINEFIICLGYRGYVIKEFFFNYHRHTTDFEVNLGTGQCRFFNSQAEDWKVTLVDTGLSTMTGGRLKRVAPHLNDETFMLTYGDGLSDIDIKSEIQFHRTHGKLATVAAVLPPGRFGVLQIDDHNHVSKFAEKPSDEIGWINGGFFVLEPKILDYITDDTTLLEQAPLMNLAKDGQLAAYQHTGFWQPCDTLRDLRELEKLWASGTAPWKVWQ